VVPSRSRNLGSRRPCTMRFASAEAREGAEAPPVPALGGRVHGCGHSISCSPKRLGIESRWVSKPLAFAGKQRPRRLSN
jgi:hypothetical protein